VALSGASSSALEDGSPGVVTAPVTRPDLSPAPGCVICGQPIDERRRKLGGKTCSEEHSQENHRRRAAAAEKTRPRRERRHGETRGRQDDLSPIPGPSVTVDGDTGAADKPDRLLALVMSLSDAGRRVVVELQGARVLIG